MECLDENITSISAWSSTPASKETLDKLKRNILQKDKKLQKLTKIKLVKLNKMTDVLKDITGKLAEEQNTYWLEEYVEEFKNIPDPLPDSKI